MIEVKSKKSQINEFEEVKYSIDEMFLKTMKPMLITSLSMILLYFIRLLMLITFWYAAYYVFVNRAFFVGKEPPPMFLPFLAIYMSVIFNALWQTIDVIKSVVGDLGRRKTYLKVKLEHELHAKKLKSLGMDMKKLKRKKLAHV